MQRIYEPQDLMEGELLRLMLPAKGLRPTFWGSIWSGPWASCRPAGCLD